ncbi:MAG: GDYXXLXY domain-containing protein [Bacteroidales bacterium]|nr:GDYXXLXY domain-containing protein [Bacteroidales bacterium]
MNSKKLILYVFILVALVQLYLPAKMIFDKEKAISSGTEYKFKTAPVDPTDPFRGKYITLRFEETQFIVTDETEWMYGEDAYVILTTDDEGYAKISCVSKTEPFDDVDFVKAKVSYISSIDGKNLSIEYPFNRFYMEESKALEAEIVYGETWNNQASVTYALVNVKGNEAVLTDVLIDGVSIREIVKERQQN